MLRLGLLLKKWLVSDLYEDEDEYDSWGGKCSFI